jgi:phosphohistidine phosphatase SixA
MLFTPHWNIRKSKTVSTCYLSGSELKALRPKVTLYHPYYQQKGRKKPKRWPIIMPRKNGKPSIAFHMIRHAESNNNKVYGDAKDLFREGSSDWDRDAWVQYVDAHRKADPHLSPLGMLQADALADGYLNPSLFEHQASSPVRILCSPMLRTLLTIRPTLERLILTTSTSRKDKKSTTSEHFQHKVHLTIVSFYYEIEGCHTKGQAEPGMNQNEIQDCLFRHILEDDRLQIDQSHIDEIVPMAKVMNPESMVRPGLLNIVCGYPIILIALCTTTNVLIIMRMILRTMICSTWDCCSPGRTWKTNTTNFPNACVDDEPC